MELMQEDIKGYLDREEEEGEGEAEIIIREESSSKLYPFSSSSSSPSLSSPPSSINYKSHPHIIPPHHHQNLWLGMLNDHHHSPEATATTNESHNSSSGLGLHHHQQDAASTNFINLRKQQQLEFMDLSLGNNKDDEANFHGACNSSHHHHHHHHGTSSSTTTTNNNHDPIEKEHMFDKVVTPSDVGKLNRLVIPKQHAEKYFPLDSSTNEKGLLLNFEDRNGKLWRFRYSYWNSSQSYVMTKGWSRFVKEKKLDAGDIVSFQRGVGELYRHRLYIDWRRRPDHVVQASDHPAFVTPLLLPNQPHYSIGWGGRLYSLPSPASLAAPRHHDHLRQLNYSNMYPFHQQHQHPYRQQQQQHHSGGSYLGYNELNSGSGGSVYYLRSTLSSVGGDQSLMGQQQEGGNGQMIIDSVPVAHHHHQLLQHGKGGGSGSSSTAGKRLRLFGVNMECAASSSSSSLAVEEPRCYLLSPSTTMANSSLPSSTSFQQYLRVPRQEVRDPLSSSSARFADQRGESTVYFDLDPPLQYRH